MAEGKKDGDAPIGRPSVLTKKGADALVRVERLLDDATRALAASASQPTKASIEGQPRQGSLASASDQKPAGQIRGN